jgi:hypothetical protein
MSKYPCLLPIRNACVGTTFLLKLLQNAWSTLFGIGVRELAEYAPAGPHFFHGHES